MKKIATFVLFSVGAFFLLMGTSYSADIDEINAAIQAKGGKWVAGETSVSGLPLELKQRHASAKVDTPDRLKGHEGYERNKRPQRAGTSSVLECSLNAAVCDWTNLSGQSFVTAVKDQGDCGSCWAFAATALLESESELSFSGQNYWDSLSPGLNVTNLNLSEQIVLSCTNPSVDNCENGGYLSDAANFLISSGTNLESCYPYAAYYDNSGTGGPCAYPQVCSAYWNNPSSNYYIYDWEYATPSASYPNDTISYIKSLLQNGPLVAWMEVYEDFDYYKSGVYSYVTGNWLGNHFVELVGWDDNLQAFKCKNSWGTGWGENGFFYIAYSELEDVPSTDPYTYPLFGYWVYWFEGGKHTPQINVASIPAGLSICTVNGSSTDCNNTPYSFEFETGSSVSVEAVNPQSGLLGCLSGCQYVFTHWNNGVVAPTLTFTEPLVGGESYTAYFKMQYELTTNPSGAGTVSPSGTTWHNAGTSVSISAKPSSGYTFFGWDGNVTGTKNPVSIVMSKSYNVTANFAQFTLVQPIGGETIPSGSTYPIEWNGPSDLVTYSIFYSVNSGVTWKAIASGITGPPPSGYLWSVPTVNKATNCLIKVVAYNDKTVIKQLKSGTFKIAP